VVVQFSKSCTYDLMTRAAVQTSQTLRDARRLPTAMNHGPTSRPSVLEEQVAVVDKRPGLITLTATPASTGKFAYFELRLGLAPHIRATLRIAGVNWRSLVNGPPDLATRLEDARLLMCTNPRTPARAAASTTFLEATIEFRSCSTLPPALSPRSGR